MTNHNGSDSAPLVEVVKGNPSDEDLAAIVAVLASVAAPPEEGPKAPQDGWGVNTSSDHGASPNVPWSFPNVSHIRW